MQRPSQRHAGGASSSTRAPARTRAVGVRSGAPVTASVAGRSLRGMNPIIHGFVGWLVAQPLARRRERAIVTLAAVLPDVDGLGLVVSDELYAAWHHRLAHGAPWAALTAIGVGLACRSPRAAVLGVAAFHTHIAMDLVGSGPGWPILYWYPFTDTEWLPSWQWDLASWQNLLFGVAVVACCLTIGVRHGRTPVELVSTRADDAVTRTLRARFRPRRLRDTADPDAR
jgi:inner membrane protein